MRYFANTKQLHGARQVFIDAVEKRLGVGVHTRGGIDLVNVFRLSGHPHEKTEWLLWLLARLNAHAALYHVIADIAERSTRAEGATETTQAIIDIRRWANGKIGYYKILAYLGNYGRYDAVYGPRDVVIDSLLTVIVPRGKKLYYAYAVARKAAELAWGRCSHSCTWAEFVRGAAHDAERTEWIWNISRIKHHTIGGG